MGGQPLGPRWRIKARNDERKGYWAASLVLFTAGIVVHPEIP